MPIHQPRVRPVAPLPKIVRSRFRTEYYVQVGIMFTFSALGIVLYPLWPVSLILGILFGSWVSIGFFTRRKIILTENEISFLSTRNKLIFTAGYGDIIHVKTEQTAAKAIGPMISMQKVSGGYQSTTLEFKSGDEFIISQNDYENYGSIKRKMFEEINKRKK